MIGILRGNFMENDPLKAPSNGQSSHSKLAARASFRKTSLASFSNCNWTKLLHCSRRNNWKPNLESALARGDCTWKINPGNRLSRFQKSAKPVLENSSNCIMTLLLCFSSWDGQNSYICPDLKFGRGNYVSGSFSPRKQLKLILVI
jgi:hypothetical protein